MVLAVKRTGDANYGRYMKVLICGSPGAGKTLISSTFPNVIYASAEGGLMSIADRQIPYVEIKSSNDLLHLKHAIDQDPSTREKILGFPVETVVLDTVDEIQRILIRERLDEQKQEALQLKDWGWLGEQMQAIVRGFRNIDHINTVFLCHLRDQQDGDSGRVWIEPGLQGAIAKQIPAAVDLSLLLRTATTASVVDGQAVKKTIRVLQTHPDLQHDWIKDRSGKLPPELAVNFDDDYKRIYEFVYGGLSDVAADEDVVEEVFDVPTPVAEAPEPELTAPESPQEALPQVIEEPTPVESTEAPGAAPAPEDTVEETIVEPVTEPVVEASVDSQTEPAVQPVPGKFFCEECGEEITEDRADLSKIRTRRVLCLEDMRAVLKG